MSGILTPEWVMGLDDETKRRLLQRPSADDLDILASRYRQRAFEQGVEKDMEQSKKILHNIHAKGFDIPAIADMTGLSVEQVRVLLNGDDG